VKANESEGILTFLNYCGSQGVSFRRVVLRVLMVNVASSRVR
jgi:hypothetical protein